MLLQIPQVLTEADRGLKLRDEGKFPEARTVRRFRQERSRIHTVRREARGSKGHSCLSKWRFVGVGVWGWVGIDVYLTGILTTGVRIGDWLVAQHLEGPFSAESKQIFANY